MTLDKFKDRIGNNIRVIREIKKITQKSLYEHINKSQATLSRYENGQSSMSIDTLFEICQFLDIPLEIMITKDLSYDDYPYINPNAKNNISQNYKHYFENRVLYLYYLSTSQDNQVKSCCLIQSRDVSISSPHCLLASSTIFQNVSLLISVIVSLFVSNHSFH